MDAILFYKIRSILFVLICVCTAHAQPTKNEVSISKDQQIEITNLHGKVYVSTEIDRDKVEIIVAELNKKAVTSVFKGNSLQVSVDQSISKSRTDIELKIPTRLRVKIETSDGEVRVSGNYESIEITTSTGTIATDIPVEDVEYNLVWKASRPKYLSDIELQEYKEKTAGKFVIKGKIFQGKGIVKKKNGKSFAPDSNDDESSAESRIVDDENAELRETKPEDRRIKVDFSTSRGIILFNVNPASVPSDLGEKPLTNAAKAIIKSGDSILMEAIRRASPKFFGDYSSTLPPFRSAPVLETRVKTGSAVNSRTKKVLVQVTDINNRSIPRLEKSDFSLAERGTDREILSVEPETTSFNLVLLVDVSGSIDNYVDFIRKAARNFVNTVDKNDKVAIVIFNHDVEVLSNFTTDKVRLSESLDTFDAGGGTAYYDALAFALSETLRPLKGDRTGIVVLTDGEDTRSFLPFDALLGAIQESGALIYPLYVPNGLIAASKNLDPNETVDPLRARYFGLTSKAESEGEKLASVSGGVYYPIRQLNELQKAYDDIVQQLRTAYSITFRSDLAIQSGGVSPFLKVRVKKENSFVKLGSVVEVPDDESVNIDNTPAKIPEKPD